MLAEIKKINPPVNKECVNMGSKCRITLENETSGNILIVKRVTINISAKE